jgi:hypothetical protein
MPTLKPSLINGVFWFAFINSIINLIFVVFNDGGWKGWIILTNGVFVSMCLVILFNTGRPNDG